MKSIRDKIAVRGIGELTDAELLAVVIDDSGLAGSVLTAYGSLNGVARAGVPRLRMTEGLGLRRAEKIAAAAELGRRIAATASLPAESITVSDDVLRIFRPIFDGIQHEECWVLYLTSSNRIVERQRVSQGGVQATVVDHRLIIKRALELLAAQIIVVHNHPSGTARPSNNDKALTARIAEAAALFDIRLLDHVIIAGSDYFSFRSHSLL